MRIFYESPRARLYLGDCRELPGVVERASVDLLATDPPYGVRFVSRRATLRDSFGPIAGDDGSLDVVGVLSELVGLLRPYRHVYVFGYSPDQLREPLRLGGVADLVWDKVIQGIAGAEMWNPSHERITFGVYSPSRASRERGDGRLAARLRRGSVLRVPRKNARAVKRHPTEKPVELMSMLVESSTIRGDVVLDPFAGCGSTLVAAVLLGREAIGAELDERYASEAARRLEAAERIADQVQAV